MKTIASTLNGLASSLCLNLGLTQVAQKLDPVSNHNGSELTRDAMSVAYCAPSQFPAKARR